MRTLAGIFLALVALFCGGCSLLFGVNDLGGSGLGVAVIWGPGLIIAGLSGWGAYKLLAKHPLTSETARGPDEPSKPQDDHWN